MASKIKLAVSTYSLRGWRVAEKVSLEKTIDWIAAAGAGGVEFTVLPDEVGGWDVKRAAACRKYCDKRGIGVAGYAIGAELLQPKARQRQEIQRIKSHIDIAAALGTRSMRHDVTFGFNRYPRFPKPRSFARAVKHVVPAVRELADYAAEQGVITSLENHGFFLQHSDRVRKLLDAVDHPNFKVTIDMGNFLCVNQDPVEAVAALIDRAVLFHVKDFHIKPKRLAPDKGWIKTPTPIAIRGAIVGHGNVDIPKLLGMLKRVRYDHYLSLEFEGLEDPRFAVTQGLAYLRTHL